MGTFDISSAYTGEWRSGFHNIRVRYNSNVWSEILSQDFADDTFFSLFDKQDGSAILLRVEQLDGIAAMTDAMIEKTLADSLKKSYPDYRKQQRLYVEMAGHSFYAVDYLIDNKRFGAQIVRHAFLKLEDALLILLLSWPSEAVLLEPYQLPAKHAAFIQGLQVVSDTHYPC